MTHATDADHKLSYQAFVMISFDLILDILSSPLVLEAHPSVPVKTVPRLIAYAKANWAKLLWHRSERHLT
jgi:hypothetical protein